MHFEEALKAHLQADAAIVQVVRDRIYPGIIPQAGSIPAIVYTIIGGAPANSLDGFTSGLVRYTVQIDIWALSYQTCLDLGKLVRDRLNVRAAQFSTYTTSYPGMTDFEPDTKRHRRMLEISCAHTEQ